MPLYKKLFTVLLIYPNKADNTLMSGSGAPLWIPLPGLVYRDQAGSTSKWLSEEETGKQAGVPARDDMGHQTLSSLPEPSSTEWERGELVQVAEHGRVPLHGSLQPGSPRPEVPTSQLCGWDKYINQSVPWLPVPQNENCSTTTLFSCHKDSASTQEVLWTTLSKQRVLKKCQPLSSPSSHLHPALMPRRSDCRVLSMVLSGRRLRFKGSSSRKEARPVRTRVSPWVLHDLSADSCPHSHLPSRGAPLSVHRAWRLFLHLEEMASEVLTLRQEAEGQGRRPGGSCQLGTLPWGQVQGHAVILVYTISRGMQSEHPPRTSFSPNHKVRQWGCQVKHQLMSVDWKGCRGGVRGVILQSGKPRVKLTVMAFKLTWASSLQRLCWITPSVLSHWEHTPWYYFTKMLKQIPQSHFTVPTCQPY